MYTDNMKKFLAKNMTKSGWMYESVIDKFINKYGERSRKSIFNLISDILKGKRGFCKELNKKYNIVKPLRSKTKINKSTITQYQVQRLVLKDVRLK